MPVDVEVVSTESGCGLLVCVMLRLVLDLQHWALSELAAAATAVLPVLHHAEGDVVHWTQLREGSQPVRTRPTSVDSLHTRHA